LSPVTCGLWPASHHLKLVAVVVDEAGRVDAHLELDRDEEGCWDFISSLGALVGLDFELVLPVWLARSNDLAHFALDRGFPVWLVPHHLAEAVRLVAGCTTGPPRRTAAALARLPLAPALRAALRRLEPTDSRQLSLL
jgi:hypothetical protein